DDIEVLDPDMKELAVKAFTPYSFRFAIEVPREPKSANSASPAIKARIDGKTAYFEGAMNEIITVDKAPAMSISW
ncbi:MAG: hypothetical protein LLF89_05490, partial [Spirochaetaceae bacterium]|nr:hypothetical protein [Spirochaetaceae bacterium]